MDETGMSVEQCKMMVRNLLEFPYPHVCRHLVADTILDILEQNGVQCPEGLREDVVKAKDAVALEKLKFF